MNTLNIVEIIFGFATLFIMAFTLITWMVKINDNHLPVGVNYSLGLINGIILALCMTGFIIFINGKDNYGEKGRAEVQVSK